MNALAQSDYLENNVIEIINQGYAKYDPHKQHWIWKKQDSEYTAILSIDSIVRVYFQNHEYVYILLHGMAFNFNERLIKKLPPKVPPQKKGATVFQ